MLFRYFSIALIFLLIPFSALGSPSHLNQLVIFGDSYSDNGNTYRISGNTYPGNPYYKGQFCDGPVWPTYLADSLKIAAYRNYAYGQAQISGVMSFDTHDSNKHTWQFEVPDLSKEIDQYFKDENVDSQNTFYFVFIGTNDFLNYIPSSKENDEKFVRLCLKALTRQINRLKAIGATHIVLFNMRDLKLSPLAHELADRYQNDYLVKLTDMVNLYNSLLKDHYKDSKQVRVFDINQFDASYFYTKLGSPCYVNNGNYIDPQNAPCLDRSNHFFYDRVHLTSSMNKELAKEVARFIVQ